MSKQIGCWRTADTINNVSCFTDIMGSSPSTTEYIGSRIMAAAGYVRNISVILTTAPSGGDSWLFTIYKNGAATALTCGCASGVTTASDTTNVVTVAVGDIISLRCQGSGLPTSTGMRWEIHFESSVPGESAYGGASSATVNTNRAVGLWNVDTVTWATTTIGQPAPMAGTITRLYAQLDGDPNPGSYTFTIVKNTVLQDGSGGTPDTRVTIGSGSTAGNASFSLSVSAGDLLYVSVVLAGSPTARRPRFGTNFISSTPGFSIVNSQTDLAWHQTNTEYWRVMGQCGQNNGTVDTEVHATVLIASFDLRSLYLQLNGNPGTSPNAYTATIRQDTGGGFADTAMTCSVVGAGATAANDGGGNVISFGVGDGLSLSIVPTSGPTLRAGGWSMVMDASAHGEFSLGGGARSFAVVCGG